MKHGNGRIRSQSGSLANLKNYAFLFYLFICSLNLSASTYYFSIADGNDANIASQAQSPQSPWKSIQKLNSILSTIRPGDQVLFKRGEIFPGQIVINISGTAGSPILFGAYGTGNKPVINASLNITNWSNIGNNVWLASLPQSINNVKGLYYNGSDLPIGRWPNVTDANKGYLTINSHSGATQLVSNQLSAAPTSNWIGAQAVYRAVHWILNVAQITNQSGNTLSLNTSGNNYDLADNFGFFIQNHPSTLDKNKEWCYDLVNHQIKILLNSDNPNSQNIEVPFSASCISITNQNYITIDNLTLYGAITNNLQISNSTFIIFQNSTSVNAGSTSLSITDGNNVSVLNNSVLNTHNNGINIQSVNQVNCNNNIIKNIGLIAGMGNSGDGQYVALNVAGYGSGPSDGINRQYKLCSGRRYLFR